jgi:Fe2+ or Zn2+ uptake regulation protein
MQSFTIICNECGQKTEITKENVQRFVNEYGWGYEDFHLVDIEIGAFVTYDTSNETVLCKCGNRVVK